MAEYLGEVLFRQGWWCKKFDTYDEAWKWINERETAEANTINPSRGNRIRELILPDTDPQAPDILFDDYF